jgi:hypothetical protein
MFVENPLPPIKRRVPPIINTRTNKIEEKVAFAAVTAALTLSAAVHIVIRSDPAA